MSLEKEQTDDDDYDFDLVGSPEPDAPMELTRASAAAAVSTFHVNVDDLLQAALRPDATSSPVAGPSGGRYAHPLRHKPRRRGTGTRGGGGERSQSVTKDNRALATPPSTTAEPMRRTRQSDRMSTEPPPLTTTRRRSRGGKHACRASAEPDRRAAHDHQLEQKPTERTVLNRLNDHTLEGTVKVEGSGSASTEFNERQTVELEKVEKSDDSSVRNDDTAEGVAKIDSIAIVVDLVGSIVTDTEETTSTSAVSTNEEQVVEFGEQFEEAAPKVEETTAEDKANTEVQGEVVTGKVERIGSPTITLSLEDEFALEGDDEKLPETEIVDEPSEADLTAVTVADHTEQQQADAAVVCENDVVIAAESPPAVTSAVEEEVVHKSPPKLSVEAEGGTDSPPPNIVPHLVAVSDDDVMDIHDTSAEFKCGGDAAVSDAFATANGKLDQGAAAPKLIDLELTESTTSSDVGTPVADEPREPPPRIWFPEVHKDKCITSEDNDQPSSVSPQGGTDDVCAHNQNSSISDGKVRAKIAEIPCVPPKSLPQPQAKPVSVSIQPQPPLFSGAAKRKPQPIVAPIVHPPTATELPMSVPTKDKTSSETQQGTNVQTELMEDQEVEIIGEQPSPQMVPREKKSTDNANRQAAVVLSTADKAMLVLQNEMKHILETYPPGCQPIRPISSEDPPSNGYPCLDCGDVFTYKSTFEFHMDRCLSDIEADCTICSQRVTFKNRCRYLEHARLHKNRHTDIFHNVKFVSFNQEQSEKAFDEWYNGAAAKRLANLVELYKYEYGPMSQELEELISHTNSSYDADNGTERLLPEILLKCTECADSLPNNESLRRHFVHNLPSNQKQLVCQTAQCQAVFFSRCGLSAHVRTHNAVSRTASAPFTCPECGMCQTSVAHLRSHLVDEHSRAPTIMNAWKCTRCAMFYSNWITVVLHTATAHCPFYFRCTTGRCRRVFKEFPDLERHARSDVHGDVSVKVNKSDAKCQQCVVCSQMFPLREELVEHLKIHFNHLTPAKIYRCPNCGRLLENRAGLVAHLEKMHSIRLREADIKDIVFTNEQLQEEQSNRTGQKRPGDTPLSSQGVPSKRQAVDTVGECSSQSPTFSDSKHGGTASTLGSITTIGGKPRCPRCPKVLPNEFLLRLHLKMDHKEELTIDEIKSKFVRTASPSAPRASPHGAPYNSSPSMVRRQ